MGPKYFDSSGSEISKKEYSLLFSEHAAEEIEEDYWINKVISLEGLEKICTVFQVLYSVRFRDSSEPYRKGSGTPMGTCFVKADSNELAKSFIHNYMEEFVESGKIDSYTILAVYEVPIFGV